MKNANKQLESVDALTKQNLAELDQFIAAASKRIQSFDAEMKEVESLLAARQLDLKNLNDTARRIEELSGQLVEMNAMVAELARTIEESGLNAASGAGYTAALARQSSEITEIREQTKGVVQRIATSRISVYVHFPRSEGDLPNRILRVVNQIEALGYPVPDTRAVANVRSLNEVRYYHAEDRDAAEKLAADTSLVLEMEGAESTAPKSATSQIGRRPNRVAALLSFGYDLEHFPAKATSLGVAKMRQINRIEHEP